MHLRCCAHGSQSDQSVEIGLRFFLKFDDVGLAKNQSWRRATQLASRGTGGSAFELGDAGFESREVGEIERLKVVVPDLRRGMESMRVNESFWRGREKVWVAAIKRLER